MMAIVESPALGRMLWELGRLYTQQDVCTANPQAPAEYQDKIEEEIENLEYNLKKAIIEIVREDLSRFPVTPKGDW